MKIENLKPQVTLVDFLGESGPIIASKTCTSTDNIHDIAIDMQFDSKLLERVVKSGHLSVTEFSDFIFAIDGFNRATETQFVRHRLSSYAIKSGRYTTVGNTLYVALPDELYERPDVKNHLEDSFNLYKKLLSENYKPEDARLILPQTLATQMLVKMNARQLLHFFQERCCTCAQHQIRNIAEQMLKCCKQIAPTIFENAGPKCLDYGYCKENKKRWCRKMPHKSQFFGE
jgi:thymidylate synthase (FAD)